MRVSLIPTSLILLLALGCAPCEKPPTIDLEAERSALLAADAAWFEAYSTSDTPADVFAGGVTADADLLPPGAPLTQGREAIREAIANLEAIPGFSVAWSPSSVHLAAGADLGYTIGSYEMTMAPEGQAIHIVGKYVTIWRKQEDGSWMVVADMFNQDGPPTPIEEPAAAE
jgi:ketosteroid isomerase-like protein